MKTERVLFPLLRKNWTKKTWDLSLTEKEGKMSLVCTNDLQKQLELNHELLRIQLPSKNILVIFDVCN